MDGNMGPSIKVYQLTDGCAWETARQLNANHCHVFIKDFWSGVHDALQDVSDVP